MTYHFTMFFKVKKVSSSVIVTGVDVRNNSGGPLQFSIFERVTRNGTEVRFSDAMAEQRTSDNSEASASIVIPGGSIPSGVGKHNNYHFIDGYILKK